MVSYLFLANRIYFKLRKYKSEEENNHNMKAMFYFFIFIFLYFWIKRREVGLWNLPKVVKNGFQFNGNGYVYERNDPY